MADTSAILFSTIASAPGNTAWQSRHQYTLNEWTIKMREAVKISQKESKWLYSVKSYGFPHSEKRFTVQHAPVGFECGRSDRVAFLTKVTMWSTQWPYTRWYHTHTCMHTHILYIFINFLICNCGKSVYNVELSEFWGNTLFYWATCHETNYLGKFMKSCIYNWPTCGKEWPYGQNFIGNPHIFILGFRRFDHLYI